MWKMFWVCILVVFCILNYYEIGIVKEEMLDIYINKDGI